MIYLASPYSHPQMSVRVARFESAANAASVLMRRGINVYSPIAHTHPIEIYGGLPGNWDFWEPFDRWFIERCSGLLVLQIDGWDKSRGVAAEIKIAAECDKQVRFARPEELEKYSA